MAVLQMQRICICALKIDRKHILEFLQRMCVIEINDVVLEDSVFQKMDVSSAVTILEKGITTSKEALRILKEYVPEKVSKLEMLNGRKEVSSSVYDEFAEKRDCVLKIAYNVMELEKSIAENKSEILRIENQRETLTSWLGLDIPMNFKGTKSTDGFIGTLPNEWTLEMVYEKLAECKLINVDIISSSKIQTNIFVLCVKEQAEKTFDNLRALGFSYPSLQLPQSPKEINAEIENQINIALKTIHNAEQELKNYAGSREDIQFLQDYNTLRADKYGVLGHLLQSKKIFVITGYLPQRDCINIEYTLNERFDLTIDFEAPSEEENVPILLKNNGFCAPLEGTVQSFSLPGKGEADPTMVMSLFYYMLFGLMLSDAMYGIIMVIVCGMGIVKFKDTMEESTKKSLKMFFYCGVATTFWGVMFGSYLGDIVDVVSTTFFGNTVTIPPVWFFPVKDPMRMLVFSMLLGVIHLFTGLGMKLYQCVKQKDYTAIIYDVMFWYMLLAGSIASLLCVSTFTKTLGLKFILPSNVGSIAGGIALIGAIGIILTNGRESRNPFKRFLKGLYALYGITGYLSDVLSYSRLLALGLATGVICTVINKMAAMTAAMPLGIIFFSIVIIFGHTLNIGINALGAYVHTTRLQYVEFFGKFYEGGGRSFNPFHVNTKYYKFKENMKNE